MGVLVVLVVERAGSALLRRVRMAKKGELVPATQVPTAVAADHRRRRLGEKHIGMGQASNRGQEPCCGERLAPDPSG